MKPEEQPKPPPIAKLSNAGRKPQFFDAHHERQRQNALRHYRRTRVSDAELERRLVEAFERKGWE